jgi:hypothetical protein
MAKTGVDVITSRARLYLGDKSVRENEQTFKDPELLVLLNDAETEIQSKRPESRLASDGSVMTVTPLTNIASPINLADKWAEAIACFIAGKALAFRATDKTNIGTADSYLKKFYDALATL